VSQGCHVCRNNERTFSLLDVNRMDGELQGHELASFPFQDKQVIRTPESI
jgi:hypothetical protein